MSGVVLFVVALLITIAGSICGVGGGVILKPFLDLFSDFSTDTINFLSGCTVLTMAAISLLETVVSPKKGPRLDIRRGSFVAIGAVIGGIIGKMLFSFVHNLSSDGTLIIRIQSAALFVITVFVLIYMYNIKKITNKNISNAFACAFLGFVLGVVSAFLGIGGGPLNIILLCYFLDMTVIESGLLSLFIIFFSQLATLLTTFATRSVPDFVVLDLVLMVIGGALGGFLGRRLSVKLNEKLTQRVFNIVVIIVAVISLTNIIRTF